jgi:UDP-N-acetylenolpyruvoylglucosamine reductase
VTSLPATPRPCRADWRFAIAYNAALQAATAALAAAGYRASRESHHHRVIQSLEFTLAPERKMIDTFDTFRHLSQETKHQQLRCCGFRLRQGSKRDVRTRGGFARQSREMDQKESPNAIGAYDASVI